jgi:Ca-activated chloride channel family protein
MNLSRYFLIGTFGLTFVLGVQIFAQDTIPPQAPVPAPEQVPPAEPAPEPQRTPAGTEADPVRLNVSVDLVNIAATVRDSAGRYLDGLREGDFTVLENGVEQKLAVFSHDSQVNLSVGVLVDVSGSMRHKLQQALQMVRGVSDAMAPQDEMFVITFNDDVNLRQGFTPNPDEIQKALRGIRSGGETSAYDAIQAGLRQMESAKNGKRILLLVSDGFDTRSKINMDQALDLLKRSQVLLYAVGIDDDDNDPLVLRQPRYHIYHYMLGELTNATGGNAFRFYTGRSYAYDNFAQLMLEELHQQYTLGYYPSAERDGSWRKLEVRVNHEGAVVRNRSGYYAIPIAQD